jgi:futalosine hydrolase
VTNVARLPSGALLVVAATEFELASVQGAAALGRQTLCCGTGPVEAAAATARTIATVLPDLILHIGIAGARSLEPGSIVIGDESVYCDLVDPTRSFPRIERAAPDPRLLEVARTSLAHAHVLAIATSARVGGGSTCADVEAMEGFAVLRAAAEAGVPALELRAVSNTFASPRSEWRIDAALAALANAVSTLLEALDA